VVSTTPETVLEDVDRALGLAGPGDATADMSSVLLALQLEWSRAFPGINTQPWQLDGVIRSLIRRHVAADRMQATAASPRGVDPPRALEAGLLEPVLRGQGISFQPRAELAGRLRTPEGSLLRWPHLYPRELSVPEAWEGGVAFALPTLRTHAGLVVAGAVHALASLLFGELPLVPAAHLHELLVDALRIRSELGLSCFVLMDATVCGDGAGPGTPRPTLQNVLLASRDPLALDAVAVRMMGFTPRQIPFVRMATEAGLGQGRVEEIDVVGEEVGGVDFGFELRRNPASWGVVLEGGAVRRRSMRLAERLSLPRFYRDAVWYPLVGRSLARHYRRTNWGRLFAHYRDLGTKS
jgi:hypothetical protein